MESWSYASDGRTHFFTDEVDFPVDMFLRSRTEVGEWDRKSIDSLDFVDLGFQDVLKSPCSYGNDNNPVLGMFGSSDLGFNSHILVATNSSLESGSNHSSFPIESSSQGSSSLINLKLGCLADCMGAQNSEFCHKRALLHSVEHATPVKRARIVIPYCQVYGCNKDLSSLKDYHKRHKVCEVHTKTPKVIVNGIEQRFCQQCSRFHLLCEFDDGKRSCRKRLAGHNERRRKPQFSGFSSNAYKLLHQYQGSIFLDTPLPKRISFLFPDMLPRGHHFPEANRYSHVSSFGEKPSSNPQSAFPVTSDQWLASQPVYSVSPFTHELAGLSTHSSRALSLLSDKAQYPKGISSSGSSHSYQSLGMCGKCKCCSPRMNSVIQVTTDHAATELRVKPAVSNSENRGSPDNEHTVDLLQLSSHLQRVEQQRTIVQMKNENEDLFGFFTTDGLRV
ncbi:unnamed protein product [Linum tenue]|uniref:SBP-type domain-containing protein n=1 Tax=Linum tenue TaxID=586396 RepID=A0AAV0HZF3_9ROSI|nr:unnamed protein product [Linum tenue]